MTDAYTPVVPRRRRRKWRRRLRRVPWRALWVLAGVGGVLGWVAAQRRLSVADLALTGLVYLVLLGAVAAPQTTRRGS